MDVLPSLGFVLALLPVDFPRAPCRASHGFFDERADAWIMASMNTKMVSQWLIGATLLKKARVLQQE